MKPWLSYTLIGLAVLLFVVCVGGFALIRMLNYFPGPKEPAELHTDAKKVVPLSIKKGKLRILSWNIQYSASRNYRFFYDGGKAVYPSKKDVEATIKAINAVVKKYNPDIILWQEIDRDSTRTYRIDQLKRFLKANSYASWAATPYHKSAYVPSPSHQHLKRVNMQLAVFSRYAIKRAVRHALPQMKESFLRKAFNLKRAVLEVEIPLQEGGSLVLLDTHLSAFSFNDGTMTNQVNTILSLTQAAERSGNAWMIAGDFNLLPPGFDPKKLGKEEAAYYPPVKTNPLKTLFKAWRSGVSVADYNKAPDNYNTYVPFGAKKADRWIDHTFVGSKAKIVNYKVLRQHIDISDHLPILIELEIKK